MVKVLGDYDGKSSLFSSAAELLSTILTDFFLQFQRISRRSFYNNVSESLPARQHVPSRQAPIFRHPPVE